MNERTAVEGVDLGQPRIHPVEAERAARALMDCIGLFDKEEDWRKGKVRFIHSPSQLTPGMRYNNVGWLWRIFATGSDDPLVRQRQQIESTALRAAGPHLPTETLGALASSAGRSAAADLYATGAWGLLTERSGGTLVLRRPVIHTDDRDRLHHGSLPAVSWPGGPYLWILNGVTVQEEMVRRPRSISLTAIRDHPNAEVRRVLIERYGPERYLMRSGAELVGEDEKGKLWRCPIPGDEALCMVEVENSTPEPDGTRKTYFMRVPERFRTAHAAIAWSFGKTIETYNPTKET